MGEFTTTPIGISPVEIHDDRGGYVDDYEKAVRLYNNDGRQVKILGMCRSACLLALGARNVCVGKNAVVMAHMSYERGTGIIRPDVTYRMLGQLPDKIRVRLNGRIRREYGDAATLKYKQLVRLGIRDCAVAEQVPLPPRRFPFVLEAREEIPWPVKFSARVAMQVAA